MVDRRMTAPKENVPFAGSFDGPLGPVHIKPGRVCRPRIGTFTGKTLMARSLRRRTLGRLLKRRTDATRTSLSLPRF